MAPLAQCVAPSSLRPVLVTLLAAAYGSETRAQLALEQALTRARLDELPTEDAAREVLRKHLHAVVAADLGPLVAEALLGRASLSCVAGGT